MLTVRKLSLLLFTILGASQLSFAGGVGRGGGGLPTDLREILERLRINTDLLALKQVFDESLSVVQTDENGKKSIDSRVQLHRRYHCRIIYATSRQGALPPSGTTWYSFTKFGSVFLDNLAYDDGTGRIPHFTRNPLVDGELIGQEPGSGAYYESMRVTDEGDLIIEGAAAELIWFRYILAVLGLSQYEQNQEFKEGMKSRGLLVTPILDALGVVLSYTYCPRDESPESLMRLHNMGIY